MLVVSGLTIGVLTAIMVSLNGLLSTHLEMVSAALIVHLAGLITVIIMMLLLRLRGGRGKSAPIYL
ncbi:MAG: hypothetical protein K0R55_2696, partial [Sporomusa sp.]|nr:hypothetical protein [Sporomusa sp.]